MAKFKNKRKLAAINGESQEEHAEDNLSPSKNGHRVNEKCITPVSEKIEGRIIKKFSYECSRINRCFSRLDEFFSELSTPRAIRKHPETLLKLWQRKPETF